MDTLVLLGSFFLLMIVGVPVAYSLGLAALVGALWMELPLDAVMIQIASSATPGSWSKVHTGRACCEPNTMCSSTNSAVTRLPSGRAR